MKKNSKINTRCQSLQRSCNQNRPLYDMNKSVVFHKIANNKETYQKNLLI